MALSQRGTQLLRLCVWRSGACHLAERVWTLLELSFRRFVVCGRQYRGYLPVRKDALRVVFVSSDDGSLASVCAGVFWSRRSWARLVCSHLIRFGGACRSRALGLTAVHQQAAGSVAWASTGLESVAHNFGPGAMALDDGMSDHFDVPAPAPLINVLARFERQVIHHFRCGSCARRRRAPVAAGEQWRPGRLCCGRMWSAGWVRLHDL